MDRLSNLGVFANQNTTVMPGRVTGHDVSKGIGIFKDVLQDAIEMLKGFVPALAIGLGVFLAVRLGVKYAKRFIK